ncbi:hypothetical protein [Hyalangium rubrum]|uniref:Uncharacterized protein n=1 Tax=Hyalangium rubrum TaxID=3103134 RepID=A0ABU5HA89_9BACT|nr:hypothetical protein [Hyalangium sp. s54d21]MDY7230161.1 hypothetical protein [Hyalangium sp. s54d21]
MDHLRAASVAWYVTGRFYVTPDGATQDLGYFLHLQGIQGELFTGEPSEQTAWFTFRSDPFKARPVTNGDLSIGLDTVGGFTLYLQRPPSASFDKPDSFSHGLRIASFRRVSLVMGTTLSTPGGTQDLMSLNVFTAALTWSQEFEFHGVKYDLARLLPHGITQWGDASATPLTPVPSGFEKVFAFVGSAIAVGK